MWFCTDSGRDEVFGPQYTFDNPVNLSFDLYRLIHQLDSPAGLIRQLEFLRCQRRNLLFRVKRVNV